MSLRVLLTGAGGFIGSHVARRLVAEGCDVFAVHRPDTTPWRLQDLWTVLHPVACDLMSPGAVDRCVEQTQPDLCIHLAWYVEPGQYLRSLENLKWVTASLRLAEALARHGCRRFVGAGTCFEYDRAVGRLTETDPTRPTSLYAASKLGLFLVLEQLASVTGMQVAWLRFFYLFGPFEDERRLVPSVVRALLEGKQAQVTQGTQVRDFLHVEDAAAAVSAVAHSGLSGPVNIGSGRPVTVREVVTILGATLGRPDAIAFGAVPDDPTVPAYVCAEIRRLRESTAWTPRHNLESGLHDVAAWWQRRLGRA